MATYANPAAERSLSNTDRAGTVVVNPFQFDFANTAYKPASLVSTDKIQIGIVPAGCVLLPHLSLVRIPIIDTSGSGAASIGTASSAANLKAAAVVTLVVSEYGLRVAALVAWTR